jgi:pimeloyl-ACP methyl ester carboxylesterase
MEITTEPRRETCIRGILRRVDSSFTASHRGGSGSALVCLHGFTDTWRTWELVLPALERHHDVLAPTLLGHAGGPPLENEFSDALIADAIERAMDDAGFGTAHIVGNSLGGYVSLQLAARGRAESVVALAPAGGWAEGDDSYKETLGFFATMQEQVKAAAPHADAIVSSANGRRRATEYITTNFEHIPAELLAHQIRGVANCPAVLPLIEYASREGYSLAAEKISCPVRIVWGTADRILPWPAAAARYREDWLPQADWVELEGVGHCPQLDVPLETAQLITGFTASAGPAPDGAARQRRR